MNRVDFGQLIAALRREHEDENLKPWTQAMLAEEANTVAGEALFNKDTISNIERGIRSVDYHAMQALATALQLTSGERKEFFLAASGIDSRRITRQDSNPQEVLSELLDNLKQMQLPTTLLDSYCDILAVNLALIELLDLPSCGWDLGSQINKPFPHNELRFLFSEDIAAYFQRLMGEDWHNYAYSAIKIFRTRSLRYRATKYFQELLHELNKLRLFKRYWREVYYHEKDIHFDTADMRMNSPKWGTIACFPTIRTAITSAGELYLSVLVPMDRGTADAFAGIADEIRAPAAFHLTSWPDKHALQSLNNIRIIV